MKRLLLILGLFSIFTATSFGQSSIAAVARKERERQKSSQSKVVVTANTTTTAAAAAPKLPAPDAAATSSAAKATGPTDNKGRDEKYWRAAFDQARDNLKRAEQRVELLDLRIKDLNKQMLQLSSFYNREYRMGPELTTAQSELEAAKKDADQARQKLSDLEDELRRSGGPAGWAR